MMMPDARIAAIAIGRNEGDRLRRCLSSLQGRVGRIVYVDSGSTDDSLGIAAAAGAEIVSLDLTLPFTAARARNEGFSQLIQDKAEPHYVQFLDGDCELQPGWLEQASAFLDHHPDVAAVCGRRRERHPGQSVYNRLIDREWDTPTGETRACGGDVLMRAKAFRAVNGFDASLIAGEEPELCLRLRAAGWRIWRLDAEMTLHDAAITRFGQWWRRTRRAGYAYAEGAFMHGAPPERHRVPQTRRALIWGLALPVTILGLAFLAPWLALILAMAFPLQVVRLARQRGDGVEALFLTLGKLPEAIGVLDYHLGRLSGRRRVLIEYK